MPQTTSINRFLVLEENTDHLELLTGIFETFFSPADIHTVETIEDCLDFLNQTEYDIVITGYFIHNKPITEKFARIVEQAGASPVIVISGSGDEHVAAQITKLGASEYLVKTRDTLEKLPKVISKYLKKQRKK